MWVVLLKDHLLPLSFHHGSLFCLLIRIILLSHCFVIQNQQHSCQKELIWMIRLQGIQPSVLISSENLQLHIPYQKPLRTVRSAPCPLHPRIQQVNLRPTWGMWSLGIQKRKLSSNRLVLWVHIQNLASKLESWANMNPFLSMEMKKGKQRGMGSCLITPFLHKDFGSSQQFSPLLVADIHLLKDLNQA